MLNTELLLAEIFLIVAKKELSEVLIILFRSPGSPVGRKRRKRQNSLLFSTYLESVPPVYVCANVGACIS